MRSRARRLIGVVAVAISAWSGMAHAQLPTCAASAADAGTGSGIVYIQYDLPAPQAASCSANFAGKEGQGLVFVQYDLPPPANVQATDGTYWDKVVISWQSVSSTAKYEVFRDSTLISPAGGITATSFEDTGGVAGQNYSYILKTLLDEGVSVASASDIGFVSTCRAPRFIGASINADMTAINGLVQQPACLTNVSMTGAIGTTVPQTVTPEGAPEYLSFSFPVPSSLKDGPYTFYLNIKAPGVVPDGDRTYPVSFTLNRASITSNEAVITYNGQPAVDGVETDSIGRMGVLFSGGAGIGFAEPID